MSQIKRIELEDGTVIMIESDEDAAFPDAEAEDTSDEDSLVSRDAILKYWLNVRFRKKRQKEYNMIFFMTYLCLRIIMEIESLKPLGFNKPGATPK